MAKRAIKRYQWRAAWQWQWRSVIGGGGGKWRGGMRGAHAAAIGATAARLACMGKQSVAWRRVTGIISGGGGISNKASMAWRWHHVAARNLKQRARISMRSRIAALSGVKRAPARSVARAHRHQRA